MKIVMIGQKGMPTLYGGIERHVEELSTHLAQNKNFEVFAYVRNYYTPKARKSYKGVKLIHLPTIATKHIDAALHTFICTWHAIFKLKPDVLHYHGVGPAMMIIIPKIFRPSMKIVFTFHCRDYFHKKWNRFAQWALKMGESIGCRMADQVIAVSEEIRQYTNKTYRRPSTYIPHGVKKEKSYKAKNIAKWGLAKNSYILVVSRLIRHKGIHYLIDAYNKLDADKKLVITGPCFHTQDYENELKKMINGNKNIILTGPQKGRTLKELYSNAYVFVSPSEQEGSPLTVLEAASFGNALVLSDILPHKIMFANLPYFFKSRKSDDLAKQLVKALRNSDKIQQLGAQTQKYARDNYSWLTVVEKTSLIYA